MLDPPPLIVLDDFLITMSNNKVKLASVFLEKMCHSDLYFICYIKSPMPVQDLINF